MRFNETHPLIAAPQEVENPAQELSSAEGNCPRNGQLSEFHLRSIRAISEAIFSEDSEAMDQARLDWLVYQYDDFMSRAPAKQRLLFSLATTILSILSPLFILRPVGFSSLTHQDKIRALRKFESRPVGKLLIPVRAILCLIYYEHPHAAEQLELHKTPTSRLRIEQE